MNAVTTLLKRISKTDDSAMIPSSHEWTEVGVLPKDWLVQSLRSCLLSVPSYGINEAAVPFDDNLPTYLRITDISEDGQFRPSPRVSVKHPNGQAFFLSEGDLVLARTGASVGKSYLYNPKDGPLVFAGFLIRISPNPEKLQPTFLAYYLQSKYYWDWVATMSIRSGQPGINGKEYGELQLPLPSLIEQRAIAEALSDVDGLINALDALIAKKRAIKQATLQQLLTGKTRLPGFSGKWEEIQIGDLFDAKAGGDLIQSRYSDIQYNRYPYPIYANGLEQQGLYGFSDYAEELAGSITVTARGALGQAFYRNTPFVAIGRLLVLKPKISLDARFFCEYINYGIHFAVESTGVPQLTAPQISGYQLPVPTEQEQHAIASVFSDMDAETAALEQRRDKTRAIKQGMMQQLLTGQVRLFESRICTDDTDDAD